jgi:hypothetical protein
VPTARRRSHRPPMLLPLHRAIAIHLCKNGFVSGYEVWTFHGESGTRLRAEDERDCDMRYVDRMD